MCVHRTLKNIGVQLIDDTAGRTIVSATTQDKAVRAKVKYGGNCAAATILGQVIAEKAIAAGVKEVAFDRGHCKYHGRVAALADAAREGGLQF
jgi:large subunit ribosomal protein L18